MYYETKQFQQILNWDMFICILLLPLYFGDLVMMDKCFVSHLILRVAFDAHVIENPRFIVHLDLQYYFYSF